MASSRHDRSGTSLEQGESGTTIRLPRGSLHRGNTFESFEDFVRKLQAFQDKVNAREHATIKTTPDALIAKDREAFSALPETRYVGIKEESRKATFDGLLSYDGSRYSVPWMFGGKHVWVRVSCGYYLEDLLPGQCPACPPQALTAERGRRY